MVVLTNETMGLVVEIGTCLVVVSTVVDWTGKVVVMAVVGSILVVEAVVVVFFVRARAAFTRRSKY